MNTPPTDPAERFIIRLESSFYDVRVLDGARQVLHDGTWMNHDAFVDALADAGEWGKVSALAKLGHALLKAAR